jgi:hypothetical protein
MNMQKLRRLLAAGVITLSASAAFGQAVIVAPMAPPAARVEPLPPPRAGYIWDSGHWVWSNGRYVSVGGHWLTVRPGYRWVPGRWVAYGPSWRWVPARWVR